MKNKKVPHDETFQQVLNYHKSYRKPTKSLIKDISTFGLLSLTCKEFMALILNCDICAYANNRGGNQSLFRSQIETIQSDLVWNSLGMLHFSYDPKCKKLITIDGHHRILALCEMAMNNTLEEYWFEEIYLQISPLKDFYPTYQTLDTQKSQTITQVLNNPDLVYGGLLAQLISMAESESGQKNSLTGRHKGGIQTLIYAMYKNIDNIDNFIKDWSFDKINDEYKKAASKDSLKAASYLSTCNITHIKQLVKGVIVVLEYQAYIAKEKTQFIKHQINLVDKEGLKRVVKDNFPNVLQSLPLIGYLLCTGTRTDYNMEPDEFYFERIFEKRRKLADILVNETQRLKTKVKLSRALDNIVFGPNVVPKKKIRYAL